MAKNLLHLHDSVAAAAALVQSGEEGEGVRETTAALPIKHQLPVLLFQRIHNLLVLSSFLFSRVGVLSRSRYNGVKFFLVSTVASLGYPEGTAGELIFISRRPSPSFDFISRFADVRPPIGEWFIVVIDDGREDEVQMKLLDAGGRGWEGAEYHLVAGTATRLKS